MKIRLRCYSWSVGWEIESRINFGSKLMMQEKESRALLPHCQEYNNSIQIIIVITVPNTRISFLDIISMECLLFASSCCRLHLNLNLIWIWIWIELRWYTSFHSRTRSTLASNLVRPMLFVPSLSISHFFRFMQVEGRFFASCNKNKRSYLNKLNYSLIIFILKKKA